MIAPKSSGAVGGSTTSRGRSTTRSTMAYRTRRAFGKSSIARCYARSASAGVEMRVEAACIDAGGHFTQHIYNFVRTRMARCVYAIIGRSGANRPIWPAKERSIRPRMLRYLSSVSIGQRICTTSGWRLKSPALDTATFRCSKTTTRSISTV
ncbi:terminase gpA endonuclease subunit [Bradyrhizobium sp. USDA 4473]